MPDAGPRPRSAATREALMRAAEKLIAERGIESVSIRGIVTAAGQKNESALQYHFGSLRGLIVALHASRQAQIRARRDALIAEMLGAGTTPSLRGLCRLMVAPAFELARADPEFNCYVQGFGHETTLADGSALGRVSRYTGYGALEAAELLQRVLPHLDSQALERRLDGALRFVSTAMVHQARRPGGFRGIPGELFFSSLLDALAGLLSAPESTETRRLAQQTKQHAQQRSPRIGPNADRCSDPDRLA